jgi:hypothetical protein
VAHPLWIRGREEGGQRRPLRTAEDGRPFDALRIHHCAGVVDPLFDRRRLGDGVGEAGAALVEDQHPSESREPAHELAVSRVLPCDIEVGEDARDVDQVDRAVADHLVGDAELPALRVLGLWLVDS